MPMNHVHSAPVTNVSESGDSEHIHIQVSQTRFVNLYIGNKGQQKSRIHCALPRAAEGISSFQTPFVLQMNPKK